jgi:hypothetical protein
MSLRWTGSLERWLWYAFLLALPLQTRIILWSGRAPFSEWFSVSLWGTDILFLLLCVLAVVRDRSWLGRRADAADLLAVALVLITALSTARAPIPLLALVGTLRVALSVLLFWYVRTVALRRFDADHSVLVFVVGALGQAMLGLAQYMAQHDLGFRMLGETLLRTHMRGVAVFYDAAGDQVLRAYGSLPHPNVLAIVLLLAAFGLLWLFVQHDTHHRGHRFVWGSAGALLTWGIAATFARTVLGAGALAVGVLTTAILIPASRAWANISVIRRRLVMALLFCAASGVLFGVSQWPQVKARMAVSSREEAVTLRIAFNREALQSGSGWAMRVNWAGVGVANFVPWLERWDPGIPKNLVQPAHNLFLLVYTETGVVGVLVLGLWIAAVIRNGWLAWSKQPALRAGLFCIAGALLLCALLDHFFWTLQQGRLLWWLTWAIIAGTPHSRNA